MYLMTVVQSTGAVEHTDYISAEEWHPPATSALIMTSNNMMMTLK